ncbi:hypothetical protein D3C87_2045900 [compost metagenome]
MPDDIRRFRPEQQLRCQHRSATIIKDAVIDLRLHRIAIAPPLIGRCAGAAEADKMNVKMT